MKEILITYSPKGGYTELIASKIQFYLSKYNCTVLCGRDLTEEIIKKHSNIIIGVATLGNETWNESSKEIDTSTIQKIINSVDFSNKKIALFGLGNTILYPNNFIDTVGIFETILTKKNANIIGYTESSSYIFNDSQALRGDKFCGLAIDFDNESSKSEILIKEWVLQLLNEF